MQSWLKYAYHRLNSPTVCICLTPAVAYTLSFQELGSRGAHKETFSPVACYKCKTISPA